MAPKLPVSFTSLMFETGKEKEIYISDIFFIQLHEDEVVTPVSHQQISGDLHSRDNFPFEDHFSIRTRRCRGDSHYTMLMKVVRGV